MWHDIAIAGSLVLVIEGILPFLSPARWRTLALSILQVDDRTVRLVGLASMLAGTAFLYLLH